MSMDNVQQLIRDMTARHYSDYYVRQSKVKNLTCAFENYKNIPYEHRSNETSDDILGYTIELCNDEEAWFQQEREEYMNELGLDTDDDSSDDPDSDYDE